jgi:hypothetical protein
MSDIAKNPQPARIPAIGDIVLVRGRPAGVPPPPAPPVPKPRELPVASWPGQRLHTVSIFEDRLDLPAVVTLVRTPSLVDVTVFQPFGCPGPLNQVEQGDAVGDWYWPPK